jgi:hypothetical protein
MIDAEMNRAALIGIAAFLGGAGVVSAAWSLSPPKAKAEVHATADHPPDDADALRRANENLTESLHACDRKLDELRAQTPNAAPSATVAEQPRNRGDGGRGGRGRGEPTTEDWERMAQLGQLRVRIPCVRDTPWKPTERAIDRLGLAPTDVKTIEDAYQASNKRVADAVRPLCAQVLGGADVADRVGTSACMDAIQNSARKTNAQGAHDALVRSAEVQAGKRQAGGDASALEQLTNALAKEGKTFESDLAAKLGPDDAKRIAWSNDLCTDRRTFRASDDPGN